MRSGADLYFNRSKQVILDNPDLDTWVRYKIFIRSPSLCAIAPAKRWLKESTNLDSLQLTPMFNEGDYVDSGKVLATLEGKLSQLINVETELLQKIGSVGASAYCGKKLVEAAGEIPLIDMHARHNSSSSAAIDITYAAKLAGFQSTSIENPWKLPVVGTMPHALIGAFGSTVEAAEAFHSSFPDVPLVVLVDYYGKELTDAVECFKTFGKDLYAVRIDTPGERQCEGTLGYDAAKEMYGHDNAGYRYGKGVTIESVFRLRRALDEAGGHKVKIVVSSGFSQDKIREFKKYFTPMDIIGTGGWPVNPFKNTATADITEYDGKWQTKVGREWLNSSGLLNRSSSR